jgi:hypothetical protein
LRTLSTRQRKVHCQVLFILHLKNQQISISNLKKAYELTIMTRFPTEHRTLISTSMENRYRMLRLVMRATLDVFVGFLLEKGDGLSECLFSK